MKKEVEKMIDEALDAQQAEEFKMKLKNGVVHFAFTKKSTGERREARGTMKKDLLPPPPPERRYDDAALANKKQKTPNPNVICYYDLDANGFRSFNISTFIEELP